MTDRNRVNEITKAIDSSKKGNEERLRYLDEMSKNIRTSTSIILGMIYLSKTRTTNDEKLSDYLDKMNHASRSLFADLEDFMNRFVEDVMQRKELLDILDKKMQAYPEEEMEYVEENFGTIFQLYKDYLVHSDDQEVIQVVKQEFVEQIEVEKNRNLDFAGRKILVVEDNDINLDIAQTLLEMKNAKVDTAVDGIIAENMFRESEDGYYDAILMDVHMPNQDGMDTTKHIRAMERKDARTIPIIAMTANAMPECIKEVFRSGMNAHVGKPVDTEKLYRILDNYMAMREKQ